MSEPFKGGQAPTLFPMMTNGLEDRATCIFFAVLGLVYPFRNILMKTIGQRAYKSGSDFECLLRPSIGGRISDKDIPDALISLKQKTLWKALVEVKIGSNDLDQAQLGRYLKRAMTEKVDALITISNEMCSNPEAPPLRLKPAEKRLRRIPHFHWSWRYIRYQAELVLRNFELTVIEKALLKQFVEFLSHEKSGIHGYNSMPKCWGDFVDTLRDGGKPKTDDIDNVLAGWFQEISDLSLILSEHFKADVTPVFNEKTIELRKDNAETLLLKTGDLEASFTLPRKKYISVLIDIDSRSFKFETVHTPTEKVKTPYKQVERFLDTFRDKESEEEWGDHSDVRIFAKWARYKDMTDSKMSDAMINAKEDTLATSNLIHFKSENLSEIIVQYTPTGAAKNIRNRKKMIEFLENQIIFFAETYVQA